MRARFFAFLAVFLCLVVPIRAEEGTATAEIARKISSFGPRFEGSAGERKTIEFLRTTARSLGFQAEVDDLSGIRHGYSRSASLLCRKSGRTDDSLVVALSLDAGPRASEQDGESDQVLAMAIGLMKKVASWDDPAVGIEFAFLGGELPPFEGMDGYPRGSLSLIASFPEGRKTAVVYLGSLHAGRPLFLEANGSGIVAPYWFFRRTLNALAETGLEVRHNASLNQLFRTRLAGGAGPAAPFLERGIPAVFVSSLAVHADEPTDPGLFEDRLAEALFRMAGPEAKAFESTWDRHYLVLGSGNAIFVLRERAFLVLMLSMLLGFIAFFTVASIVMREGFVAFMKGVLRFILSLVFAFGLCYAIIALASLAFAVWGNTRGWPPFWSAYRSGWIWAKALIMAGLGAAFLVMALKTKLLPSSLAFYGGSAMALLFIDVFIFTSMDLSYSVFFAWAFVFCILAVLVRSAFFAMIAFAMTFAPLVWFAMEAAPVGGERLARILLLPGPIASVVLAFIVLPVLLLLVRILMLIRGRTAKAGGRRLLAGSIFGIACFLSGTALLAASDPFAGDPVPVKLEASIDADARTLAFSSASGKGAGKATLRWNGTSYGIPLTGTATNFDMPPGFVFRHSVSRSTFLSRKTLRLVLDGGRAESLRAWVSGSSGQFLYDCTFPFTTDLGTGETEIHLGSHPVFPLVVEMTVPGDFRGEFRLEGRTKMEGASLEDGYEPVDASVVVRQGFAVE